jgi:hypothetical protein
MEPPPSLLERLRRRLRSHPRLLAVVAAAAAALAAHQLYRRSVTERDEADEDEVLPSDEKPQFSLAKSEGFYAFVFSPEAICIAHGGDASNVGRTLAEIFQNEEVEDASELHERFLRTAAAGGGWCAYSWRSSPTALRLKGAYIVAVSLGGGKKGYAGVGYMLCPPESASKALGLCALPCRPSRVRVRVRAATDYVRPRARRRLCVHRRGPLRCARRQPGIYRQVPLECGGADEQPPDRRVGAARAVHNGGAPRRRLRRVPVAQFARRAPPHQGRYERPPNAGSVPVVGSLRCSPV